MKILFPGLCLAPALTFALGGFDSETPELVWNDFDGDGLADLVSVDGDGALGLFKNLGDGDLQEITATSGVHVQDARSVSWQDVDGDGAQDLFVLHQDGRSSLFRRQATGRFEDVTQSTGLSQAPASHALRWVDYDEDGHVDLVLFTRDGASLWHNDGLGVLSATSFEWSRSIAAVGLSPSGIEGEDALVGDRGRDRSTGGERTERARRPAPAAGGAGRLSVQSSVASGAATAGAGHDQAMLAGLCAPGVIDQATGQCLSASSDPTLNQLYPLSQKLFVDVDGEVGFGTLNPQSNVHIKGAATEATLRLSTATPQGTSKLELFENNNPDTTVGGHLAYNGATDELQFATVSASSEDVRMVIERADGKVGFGTVNPRSELHVKGAAAEAELRLSTTDQDGTAQLLLLENNNAEGNLVGGRVGYDGAADQVRIATLGSGTEKVRMVIDRPSGDVGIGTTAPEANLHVVGGANVGSVIVAPNDPLADKYSELILGENDDASLGMKVRYDGLNNLLRFQGLVSGTATTHLAVHRDTGRVGIGTTNPGGALQVVGDDQGSGAAAIRAINSSAATGVAIVGESNGDGTTAIFKQFGTGSILKGETAAGGTVFRVSNTGRVITTALEITGGGDLVEGFESVEELEPGTVVSIDPARPGQLMASAASYDTKVAGVVSGAGGVNHGIRMGQDDVLDGDTLVAMAGRVWVKTTTENGPVQPGDLLTTSTRPGHAMRAAGGQRSFGAVLGKAMSALDADTGLVLVLVNLQ